MTNKRISTGLPKLDKVMEGGIPENSVVLVTGGPGSGKTTFSCQFLWQGLKNGEECLYITTEELPEDIIEDSRQFGWNFDNYRSENFKIETLEPSDQNQFLPQNVRKLATERNYERIVIDSISVFGVYWRGKKKIRQNLNNLVQQLKELDTTTLLTAEFSSGEGQVTRYGISEYVSDGVIKISGLTIGGSDYRSIQVTKMRRTNIDGNVLELKHTSEGLKIGEETI